MSWTDSLFRVSKVEQGVIFDAAFAHQDKSAYSATEHFSHLVWLDAVLDFYRLSYPGMMTLSDQCLEYMSHFKGLEKSMKESLSVDSSIIMKALHKGLSQPASSDLKDSYHVVWTVMPLMLVETQGMTDANLSARVTSRWNREKSCRLIRCPESLFEKINPLSLSYWTSSVISAVEREYGKRAYFHDASDFLDKHEGYINEAHEERHKKSRYLSIAINLVSDYLKEQPLKWLNSNSGTIDAIIKRLYSIDS